MGVLDVFTQWDLRKRAERIKGAGISSVEPESYMERFLRLAELHYTTSSACSATTSQEEQKELDKARSSMVA